MFGRIQTKILRNHLNQRLLKYIKKEKRISNHYCQADIASAIQVQDKNIPTHPIRFAINFNNTSQYTFRSFTAISEFNWDAHSYIHTLSAYGSPYNRYNFLLTSKSCLSELMSFENDS